MHVIHLAETSFNHFTLSLGNLFIFSNASKIFGYFIERREINLFCLTGAHI